MESPGVLGLVGGKERSGRGCALAEVSGFIPLTDLASPVAQVGLLLHLHPTSALVISYS